jgi:hypothetical protein
VKALARLSLAVCLSLAALQPPAAVAMPPAGIQYVPAAPNASGPSPISGSPAPRSAYLPGAVESALEEPGAFTPRDVWALRLIGSSPALGAPPPITALDREAAAPPSDFVPPSFPRALATSLGGPGIPLLLGLLVATAAVLVGALVVPFFGRDAAGPRERPVA